MSLTYKQSWASTPSLRTLAAETRIATDYVALGNERSRTPEVSTAGIR